MIQGYQANTLPSPRVRLVIIDSVTPLLAPSLSAVSSHGHAIMTTFMQHLRSMARSYYLASLVSDYTPHMASCNSLEVVNNTAGSPQNPPSTTRKPALGPSFTFLTDCTLWLARRDTATNADAGSSTHVAEILRSRSTVRVHDLATRRLLNRINLSDRGRGVRSRFRTAFYVQRHEHDSTRHGTGVKTSVIVVPRANYIFTLCPSNDRAKDKTKCAIIAALISMPSFC